MQVAFIGVKKEGLFAQPLCELYPVLFFRPQIFDEYLGKSERGRANVVPFSLLNLFDID